MTLYEHNILDHFRHPRNAGRLGKPTAGAKELNESCGDEITLDLSIENGVIKDLKFEGKGCAISQAAMSMLSERVKGTSLKEARSLGEADVLQMLGVKITGMRMNCAMLGLKALKTAIGLINKKDNLSANQQ